MIRITVELLPFGQEEKAQHLGTAIITNDATGTRAKGNYIVQLSHWGNPKETWRKGHVEGFAREKQGAWDLLLHALKAAPGSREAENVKTSFVPYVEEPPWEMAPDGYGWCIVQHNGACFWANEEPFVVNGHWTVRVSTGGKFQAAGHVALPLGVDFRICKWTKPSAEVKERIKLLQEFGRHIVS